MDGTGYLACFQRVFDAAIAKAYGGKKKIAWFEVYAGERPTLFTDPILAS